MKRLIPLLLTLLLFVPSSFAANAQQIESLIAGLQDVDGTPLSGAIVVTRNVANSAAQAVWEDKDKTLPSPAGKSQFNLASDGTALVFGDSFYTILVYASTDTGLTTPIKTLEGVGYVETTLPAHQVIISATDTTPDYLEGKITAGTNIETAVLNPAADESLQISLVDIPTLPKDSNSTIGGSLFLAAPTDSISGSKVRVDLRASGGADLLRFVINDTDAGAKLVFTGAPSGDTNQILTEANINTLVPVVGRYGALYVKGNAQSITSAFATIIDFDSVGYEDDVNFITGDSRIYIPADSGITRVTLVGRCTLENGIVNASANVTVYKNGVSLPRTTGYTSVAVTANLYTSLLIRTEILDVSEGDYFELVVSQNTGDNMDLFIGHSLLELEVIE